MSNVIRFNDLRKRDRVKRQPVAIDAAGLRPDAKPSDVDAVVHGVGEGPVVCTACGARFAVKERQARIPPASLDDHWAVRPECKASLSRPVGQFDPPKIRTTRCCAGCHDRATAGFESPPCATHAYRGCPGC